MSWGISIQGTTPDTFVEDLALALSSQVDPTDPVPDDQFTQAHALALAAMASGVLGDVTRQFDVSVGGHANPDHEPEEGSSPDSLTVTVRQRVMA